MLLSLNRYDHQERLTAQEAMAHPYFAPVRAAAAEHPAKTGSREEVISLLDSDD